MFSLPNALFRWAGMEDKDLGESKALEKFAAMNINMGNSANLGSKQKAKSDPTNPTPEGCGGGSQGNANAEQNIVSPQNTDPSGK